MTLAVALGASSGRAEAQALTEADVVARAIEGSPSLRAAFLDLQAAEEDLRAAEAAHRPAITTGVDGGRSESLSATTAGVAPNADNRVGLDVGLNWTAPVGTTLAVEAAGAFRTREVNRDPSTTTRLSIGPTWSVEGRVEVAQPLLRGAGRDVGEAEERQARLSVTAAEHARDRAASELLRDVLSAYWSLWYAQSAILVQQAGLELARQQLDEAEARVSELGAMARADTLRYASELASIEEALSDAEVDQRGRALELGRLLGLSAAESARLVAAGAARPAVATGEAVAGGPVALDAPPGLAQAIEAARQSASELSELEAELRLARDRSESARDAALPRLDLQGSVALGGLWSQEGDATVGADRPAISALAGLELELPLGNGRALAQLDATRRRAEALEARLDARTLQIEAEVARAWSELQGARRRLVLAERSVEVSRQLAEAERARLALGTSTPLSLIEAQESQRQTELRSLRARVDGETAALALGHLTGELLGRASALTVER